MNIKKETTNGIHQQITIAVNRQPHRFYRSKRIEWSIEHQQHNTNQSQSWKWTQEGDTNNKSLNWTVLFNGTKCQIMTLITLEHITWVKRWNQIQHSPNSIWVVRTNEHTKRHPPANHSFRYHHITDNIFGDVGATSLSEALESNTTLTKLDLNSEKTRYQEWNCTFL